MFDQGIRGVYVRSQVTRPAELVLNGLAMSKGSLVVNGNPDLVTVPCSNYSRTMLLW